MREKRPRDYNAPMSPTPGARVFTLDDARAMLPQIQELTAAAARELDPLMQQLEGVDENAPEHSRLHDSITLIVTAWAEAVQDLGAEAKGLWLVDFDAGRRLLLLEAPRTHGVPLPRLRRRFCGPHEDRLTRSSRHRQRRHDHHRPLAATTDSDASGQGAISVKARLPAVVTRVPRATDGDEPPNSRASRALS